MDADIRALGLWMPGTQVQDQSPSPGDPFQTLPPATEVVQARAIREQIRRGNATRHQRCRAPVTGNVALQDACGFPLLALTAEDYRAIQSLLNAGGFDTGTPDGVWGPASQRALRRFQAEFGLPETGAPDRATLEALGAVD